MATIDVRRRPIEQIVHQFHRPAVPGPERRGALAAQHLGVVAVATDEQHTFNVGIIKPAQKCRAFAVKLTPAFETVGLI